MNSELFFRTNSAFEAGQFDEALLVTVLEYTPANELARVASVVMNDIGEVFDMIRKIEQGEYTKLAENNIIDVTYSVIDYPVSYDLITKRDILRGEEIEPIKPTGPEI